MTTSEIVTPQIVSRAEWRRAHERLLAEEKSHLRAGDRLAAARRHAPMVEVDDRHRFASLGGEVTLRDLFEGRPQLVLYSFMLEPGGEPCSGCSFFADQIGHPAHLHARGTTVALVSRAPVAELEAHRARMGWELPWYSLDGGEAFYDELGVGPGFALNVFLAHGGRILHSYSTTGRGVEQVGTAWSILDRTPLGRQEHWEDAPAWVEQGPPYVWWRLHDEYEDERATVSARAPAGRNG
jgi:predicted dithiol-disulfide oxidoreductase (DUF899 family)